MSKAALAASTAASAILIALNAEGAAPEWVKLLPYGEIVGRDGRRWTLPREAVNTVINASMARAAGEDLVFDYCHQSDLAAVEGVGGVAPASGWIKELQSRDDGIYARVSWTPAAKAALQAQEYRYASPVFSYDKAGRVTKLLRASLTNTPNLVLGALASEQGDTMDLTKLAQALGLGADATMDQILEAVANLKTAAHTAMNSERTALATALGIDAASDAAAILAAATALKAKSGDGAAIVALQSEVNTLKAERAKEQAEAKVDAAVTAGKINPAAREHFLALAAENPAQFDKIVGATPAIVAPGAKVSGKGADGDIALTAEQKALCSQMGWNEADYLAQLKEEANAQ